MEEINSLMIENEEPSIRKRLQKLPGENRVTTKKQAKKIRIIHSYDSSKSLAGRNNAKEIEKIIDIPRTQ